MQQRLMGLYAEPLKAYFLATQYRNTFEADDVVHGFFADRLGRYDWIENWRASGKRLRRWLMTGLGFYLKELARREKSIEEETPPLEVGIDAEDLAEMAFTRDLVKYAMQRTQEWTEDRDFNDHWDVFVRH